MTHLVNSDWIEIDLSAHLEEMLGSECVSELPETPEEISAVTVFIVGSAEADNCHFS